MDCHRCRREERRGEIHDIAAVPTIQLNMVLKVIKLSLRRKCRIAPSQMRIVPLHISQSAPFHDSELHVEVTMVSEGMSKVVAFLIPIRNLALRNASAIRATYFYGQSMPTAFIAIPPSSLHVEQSHPIFLALRECIHISLRQVADNNALILIIDGAGVDIFEQHFWRDSLPRNKYNWVVVPSGRTSWVWHHSDIDPLFSCLSIGIGLAWP